MDLQNIPIGGPAVVDFVQNWVMTSPAAPCEQVVDDDGNTEPITYTSYKYGSLLPNTHKLKLPLSKLVGTAANPVTRFCSASVFCHTRWGPSGIKPGRYYLRHNFLDVDSGAYGHSAPLALWLTRAGKSDLYTKSFNITNEKTVCGGEQAEFVIRLVNYGEIGGEATALVYRARNEDMTEELEVVDVVYLEVPGGGGASGVVHSGSFTMPEDMNGKYFFGVKAFVPGSPYENSAGWGAREKVVLKPDVYIKGNTWQISSPEYPDGSSVLPVGVQEVIEFSVEVENRGNSPSAAGTLVQLEIKKKNKPWKVVQDALFELGSVPCTALGESISYGPFSVGLESDYADFDDWNKKRTLRLRVVSAGNEWSTNNNKTKRKRIRVKEPLVEVDVPRVLVGGQQGVAAASSSDPAADSYEYSWTLEVLPQGATQGAASLLVSELLPDEVVAVEPQVGVLAAIKAGNYIPNPELLVPEFARIRLEVTAGGSSRMYEEDVQLQPTASNVHIAYSAFIKCDLIPGPLNWIPILGDSYFSGDGHGFGYPAQPNRIARDAFVAPGQYVLDVPYQDSFSKRYGHHQADEGPVSEDHCENYCRYSVPRTAVPECAESGTIVHHDSTNYPTAVVGQNGELVNGFTVLIGGYGGVGCAPGPGLAADIDYSIRINFREDFDEGGVLLGYSFQISAVTDGFPWHQVVVGDYVFHAWDPCEDVDAPFPDTVWELVFNDSASKSTIDYIPLYD